MATDQSQLKPKRNRVKKGNKDATFHWKDYLVFLMLYRQKLLSEQMIYDAVFKDKYKYRPRTLEQRLIKLKNVGYLNCTSYQLQKPASEFNPSVKMYSLTQKGVTSLINGLEMRKNSGEDGLERYHYDASDLETKYNFEFWHNVAANGVASAVLDKVVSRSTRVNDLSELIYGRDFRLRYGHNEEKSVHPDYLFFKEDDVRKDDLELVGELTLYETSNYFVKNIKTKIALEEDNLSERQDQIVDKLSKYNEFIKENESMFNETPLYIVFSINDNNRKSKKKRISYLKRWIIQTMNQEITKKQVVVYVVEDSLSKEIIPELILEDQTFDDERIDFFIQNKFERRLNTTLSEIKRDLDILRTIGMGFSITKDFVFKRPNNTDYHVFVHHMMSGDVHGELNLIRAEQYLNQSVDNGIVVAMYLDVEHLNEDIFHAYSINIGEQRRKVHIGPRIFFTTIDDLEKGVGWIYDKGDTWSIYITKNKISKVRLEDVLVQNS